jgi:curved DNA-binding protein CbpA
MKVERRLLLRSLYRISVPPLSLALLVLFALLSGLAAASDEDLYQLLGVTRLASTQEIKTAYRRKARDTHPDKRKDVPPEEAAESFRKVVHAFEILSDSESRKHYDRTGRAEGPDTHNGGWNQQHARHQFTWSFQRRPVRLKDRFDVQEAQSRVLHVVSLEQLRTVLLDDNDLLERHLLMCFVTPDLEKHVDDEMVFPFPFAAMSSQGIWWEDLLQTVQVRFNRGNDLTRFFGIPSGDDVRNSGRPIFVFGKRGQPLSSAFERIQTSNRQEFETWVWKMIEVPVEFVNRHDHPVEIYWVHGTRAHLKATLPANHRVNHTSMLTHEWYIRDARVDSFSTSPGRWKLSEESSLGSWKIGIEGGPRFRDDGSVEIIINRSSCFDLSGHCPFWRMQNECVKNPNFMSDKCPLTCKVCQAHGTDKPYDNADSIKDEL